MARRGAFRAFAAGTAIAGLMGVGAVCVARSYGITSVQQSGAMLRRYAPAGASVLYVQATRPPHCTYRLRASVLYVLATRTGLLRGVPSRGPWPAA